MRKPRTATGEADGVSSPENEKDAPTAAQEAAVAIPEKTPAAVCLTVAANQRTRNPRQVDCIEDDGAKALLRIPAWSKPYFVSGMKVKALLVAANMYCLEGKPPRARGRW